jgi:hypothetical protein
MIGSLPVPIFVLLLVVGILIAVFVPLGIVFGTIRRRYYPDARIIEHGEPAEATIRQRWQTGVRVNRRFGIGLELEVRRPGHPPYTAQARAMVGIFDAARFQEGAVIPVKVDPQRPERVFVNLPDGS